MRPELTAPSAFSSAVLTRRWPQSSAASASFSQSFKFRYLRLSVSKLLKLSASESPGWFSQNADLKAPSPQFLIQSVRGVAQDVILLTSSRGVLTLWVPGRHQKGPEPVCSQCEARRPAHIPTAFLHVHPEDGQVCWTLGAYLTKLFVAMSKDRLAKASRSSRPQDQALLPPKWAVPCHPTTVCLSLFSSAHTLSLHPSWAAGIKYIPALPVFSHPNHFIFWTIASMSGAVAPGQDWRSPLRRQLLQVDLDHDVPSVKMFWIEWIQVLFTVRIFFCFMCI